MSGTEIITRQQKNTSFGANEFRDGISYSEQEQKKQMIETSDLASLATGQCYVFLPEPIRANSQNSNSKNILYR